MRSLHHRLGKSETIFLSPSSGLSFDYLSSYLYIYRGYVFILDSLGYGATAPAKVLSQYLKMEAIEHHGWRADDPWTPLPTFKVDVRDMSPPAPPKISRANDLGSCFL